MEMNDCDEQIESFYTSNHQGAMFSRIYAGLL